MADPQSQAQLWDWSGWEYIAHSPPPKNPCRDRGGTAAHFQVFLPPSKLFSASSCSAKGAGASLKLICSELTDAQAAGGVPENSSRPALGMRGMLGQQRGWVCRDIGDCSLQSFSLSAAHSPCRGAHVSAGPAARLLPDTGVMLTAYDGQETFLAQVSRRILLPEPSSILLSMPVWEV